MDSTSTTEYTVGMTDAPASGGESLKDQVIQQGQEKVGQVAEQFKGGVASSLKSQKDRVAQGIDMLCDGLHQMGNQLSEQGNPMIGRYLHTAHHSLERYSEYLRERELEQMVDDVQSFARQNPSLIIGGLFAAGFLAGRFLRSSNPQTKALAIYTGEPAVQSRPTPRFEESATWR